MRGLAKIAQDLGDGDIRLTVWQNLLIPGVRDENVELAIAAIEAIGLAVEASQIRAGLIACTGNAGCKFAASNTKRHAAEIGDWCEPRVNIETPLNIHLTGCHHSCAQHYISDIGLIAAKVPVGEEDDTSRAITCSPAAASVPMPMSGRRSITTSRPRTRRRRSSGC